MSAAVTDLDGKITGAHRTWLNPRRRDKAPIDTPRRAMRDHDDYEPHHESSPTDHVLNELQLHGYRPFAEEPDQRLLPDRNQVAGPSPTSSTP